MCCPGCYVRIICQIVYVSCSVYESNKHAFLTPQNDSGGWYHGLQSKDCGAMRLGSKNSDLHYWAFPPLFQWECVRTFMKTNLGTGKGWAACPKLRNRVGKALRAGASGSPFGSLQDSAQQLTGWNTDPVRGLWGHCVTEHRGRAFACQTQAGTPMALQRRECSVKWGTWFAVASVCL